MSTVTRYVSVEIVSHVIFESDQVRHLVAPIEHFLRDAFALAFCL